MLDPELENLKTQSVCFVLMLCYANHVTFTEFIRKNHETILFIASTMHRDLIVTIVFVIKCV